MFFRFSLFLSAIILCDFVDRAESNDHKLSETVFSSVFTDEHFIEVVASSGRSVVIIPGSTYNEKPQKVDGVFWQEGIVADIYGSTPPQVSVFGQSRLRVWNTLSRVFTQAECQSISWDFVKRHFSWFQDISPSPTLSTTPPSLQRKGIWGFDWKQFDSEGLISAEISVYVRAFDGKIVSFSTIKQDWPDHKAHFSKVKENIFEITKKNVPLEEVSVIGASIVDQVNLFGKTNLPNLLYRVVIRSRDKLNLQTKTAVIYANVDTGELIWLNQRGEPAPSKIIWRSSRHGEKGQEVVGAWAPALSKQGLIFAANLNLMGMPKWIPATGQAFLKSSTTQGISFLTSDLSDGHGIQQISSLPNSDWFTVSYTGGWSYAINLQTAQRHTLGNPERGATTPTVDTQGRWGVISTTGRTGNQDSDLFFKRLNDTTELGLRTRIILPKSDDYLPVFSLDGKWLFFISETEKTMNLCKISTELLKEGEPVHPRVEHIEKIALPFPSQIRKVTFFPDGRKLLLDTLDKPLLLDLVTEKIQSVELKVSIDKELGGAKVKVIKDVEIVAGKDGEIIFCGETSDTKKITRLRLYSYNLGTKVLRALSPPNADIVPPHRFASSKETVFSLNKAIAFSEIAWEKKRPKNFTE